ncbi:restriction endonuclease subunit S [Bacillus atrophaeus]|uniref:restriction endonuclease subunit S n=1 Tax=Bacillus atrophaeus TaxID=1452 RepID=UPI002281F61E|nr:restriction endonuclease subunit S [Bacillus atrophaeus]MCY9107926.1 restriction endonuclease subunit S [Bacillus atrophaeus]MEC0768726.1 restriction endonuclease subunit S [Bacillus atrophaeus]MEC0780017.1 restriction endonuclease subunit S [Bacillus atrophaeus]MEC0810461.1 restriction endonuclease subunit S [Bacillus atrophaeus]
MKINEVFYLIRGKVTSNEDLYSHVNELIDGERYPVYSSKTAEKGLFGYLPFAMYPDRLYDVEEEEKISYVKDIDPKEFESITWTTDGVYAGTMFVRKGQYSTTNVCGTMVLREEYKDKVSLDWFVKKYQGKVYKEKKSQDTNGKVMSMTLGNIEVDIPSIEKQEEELKSINKLIKIKSNLTTVLEEIDMILSKIIQFDDVKEYKVGEVFLMGTGRRIISSDIYNNLLNYEEGNKEIIPIVSSGAITNKGIMGYGDIAWLGSIVRGRKVVNAWDTWKNQAGENYIIDTPCVTWNTDGSNVGTLYYRENKFYPTDHCGVLIPKDEYKDKINLKFFAYIQQYHFKKERGRANLHLSEMAPITFEIPDIDVQNDAFSKIEKLEKYKNKLENIISNINDILEKDIQ